MNQPTECKHCGLHATWHIDEDTFLACGTIYAGRGDYWNQSTGCVEIMQSRKRIQRATKTLEDANQMMMRLDDDEDVLWVVESQTVSHAIEILEGEEDDDINAPETPDSSPITTDDLAVSDYYEAVRKRVPWMVTVEHIEALVEVYRQCGVMVWQAAEQIQLVHGGEYGKAE